MCGGRIEYSLEINEDVLPEREVVITNRHVRFNTDDSDLSDFSDSIEANEEEQESLTLYKVKRRHKKKLVGGGKPLQIDTLNFVQLAELVKGGKGRGKKNSKLRNSLNNVVLGNKVVEEGRTTEDELIGSIYVTPSPSSGLKLIHGEEGTQVPETPPPVKCEDPLKKLEATSLFGIQNGLGFSFFMPRLINTKRLEVMEVVDVKKNVTRERSVVDQ